MDGWSDEVRDCLEDTFAGLEQLVYEVRNCVRGAYTGANTNEELADHIRELAEALSSSAEYLCECEDNSALEEDE